MERTGVVVVLALAAALWPAGARAQNEAGEIAGFEGQAGIVRQNLAVETMIGSKVFAGDVLATGPRSKIIVLMRDASVVILGADARLSVDRALVAGGQRQTLLKVMQGKVRALVTKVLTPGSSFDFVTPTSVAGVRGTTIVVEVVDPKLTKVYLLDGAAAVRNPSLQAPELALGPGMFTEIPEGQQPMPPQIIPQELLNILLEDTSARALAGASVRTLPGVRRFSAPMPPPAPPPGAPPPAEAEASPAPAKEEPAGQEAIELQTGFSTAPFGTNAPPGREPFNDFDQLKPVQDAPVNVKVDTFRY